METNKDVVNNPLFEALPRRKITPAHVHAHRRVKCKIEANRLPLEAVNHSMWNRMESEEVDYYDIKVLRQMLRNHREESARIKDFMKEHPSNKSVNKVANEQLTELKYKKEENKLETLLIRKYLSKIRKKEDQEDTQKRPSDDSFILPPRKKQKIQ